MGLFKSLADVIFDKLRIDSYIPKQEMVEIEASELAWLRQQAAQNPSRGRITPYPKEDRNDPEETIARTECAKDPGFRDWYHREGKRLHHNGRDMVHTYDIDRLYSIYAKTRDSVK